MKLFILFPDSVFAFFLLQFRKNPGSWSVKRQIVGKGVGVESSFIFFWIVMRLTSTPFSSLFQHIYISFWCIFYSIFFGYSGSADVWVWDLPHSRSSSPPPFPAQQELGCATRWPLSHRLFVLGVYQQKFYPVDSFVIMCFFRCSFLCRIERYIVSIISDSKAKLSEAKNSKKDLLFLD